jgi:nucleoside-diphosphate-sugar epimerase
LARLFRANSWKVVEAIRKPSQYSCDQIRFDLSRNDPILIPQGVDVLIHCAYDFKALDWDAVSKANIERTEELFASALSAGCKKSVFVSSMAAFREAKSFYGKAKYEAELRLAPKGVISIRPGLIYGSQAKGIVGAIQKYVVFLPVIPIIGDGSQIIYLSHIDDLCQAIFEIVVSAEIQTVVSPMVLANPDPIPLKQLIVTFANENKRKVLLVPVPPVLILFFLLVVERLGFRIGLRSDSVLSIINSNPDPWSNNLWHGNVRFRSLKDG